VLGGFLLYQSIFVFPKEILLEGERFIIHTMFSVHTFHYERENIKSIDEISFHTRHGFIIKLKDLPKRAPVFISIFNNEVDPPIGSLYIFLTSIYPAH
jgi:hypothetical protein